MASSFQVRYAPLVALPIFGKVSFSFRSIPVIKDWRTSARSGFVAVMPASVAGVGFVGPGGSGIACGTDGKAAGAGARVGAVTVIGAVVGCGTGVGAGTGVAVGAGTGAAAGAGPGAAAGVVVGIGAAAGAAAGAAIVADAAG